MNDNILLLKQSIFHHAKFFIEKNGLFCPFGAKVSVRKITEIFIYDDSQEVIGGEKLVTVLKDSLSTEIKQDITQAGAIAYDIVANFKNLEGIFEKRDALCLAISTDGETWKEDYFPYKIIDGKCLWE